MTAPKKLPFHEAMKIVARRKQGLWVMDETRQDAELSFRQMKANDVAITVFMRDAVFNVYNTRELNEQIKHWKETGCVCLPCNTQKIKVGDKDAVMWIVQPKVVDETTPSSPLALAYGMMVNGFAYISKDEKIPNIVTAILGSTE
jgi:hypothetical protein